MRSTGFFWTRGLAVDLEMLRGKELADAALAGRRRPPSPALARPADSCTSGFFGTSFDF